MEYAIVFMISIVSSFILCFPLQAILKCLKVVDHPNERSSHRQPTARGGGISIIVIVLILGAYENFHQPSVLLVAWLILSLMLAIVSFWDDLRTLHWKVRLCAHAFVALAFVSGLILEGRFAGLSMPITSGLVLLLFLLLAGYANAFNFMDGINGIAACQAAVTGIGTIAITVASGLSITHPALMLATIIAGAAAGFLPHNFPNARMFMGDVGSVPIGFGLAAIAVWIAADQGWWLLAPLTCLHANFILDAIVTVGRRILRGEAFHQAHREHFYQRLTRSGWSHTRVTMTELALQIVATMVLALTASRAKSMIMGAVIAVVILWIGFFLFCENRFDRAKSKLPEI